MPCHVVGGVRCQVDHCSLQVCHLSQSTSRDIWQPALHQRPQTLRVDERGVNNPAEKRDSESETKKTHYETRRHHSSELWVTASFLSHHCGDKNKPYYPLKKGHGISDDVYCGTNSTDWRISRGQGLNTGTRGRLADCSKPLVKYL